jgi:phosphoesterase RecJ-like protein
LIETEQDIFNASFRTRNADKYDVSKIAVAFGGGGHQAAAGARIEGTKQIAVEKLLASIKQLYPDISE